MLLGASSGPLETREEQRDAEQKASAKFDGRWLGIVAIAAVGLLLRVVGSWWGLPEDLHPDEPFLLGLAEHMGPSNLRPGFYIYPTFFIYQLMAIRLLVEGVGGDYANLVLMSRLLAACYGLLTIAAVYALGARLGGRRLGLSAAALCALTGALTLHAHYAVTDTPMAALATAAVWLSVRGWQQRSFRGLFVAAAVAGLAVSTKYNAAPVVFAPMLGFVGLAARSRMNLARGAAGAVAIGAVAVVAFAATSPYALIDYPDLIRDLRHESTLQVEARPGDHVAPLLEVGLADRGLVANLPVIAADMGIVASLLALGCLAVVLMGLPAALQGAAHGNRTANAHSGGDESSWDGLGWGMAAAWLLLYYALMAPSAISGQRYMLPIYPILAVLAAGGIELVVRRYAARLTPRRHLGVWQKAGSPAALLAALILVAASRPASQALSSTWLLAQRDTRLVARDWALANLPPNTRLGREHYAPPFHSDDGLRVVVQPFSLTEHGFDTYCDQEIEYLFLSSANSSRYFEDESERFAAERGWYEELPRRARLVHAFPGAELQIHHPTIEVRRLFCPGGD